MKLPNGTKKKSLKNKMPFKFLSLPDAALKSFVSKEDMRDPVHTRALKWVAMHPCVYTMYGLEKKRDGGSHKGPCGASVGRHCGVSSSACGIPSVYPSASCPSKGSMKHSLTPLAGNMSPFCFVTHIMTFSQTLIT